MCGVVGYSRTGADASGHRGRFIDLCSQSRIRGEHAYGIAYIDSQNELQVVKSIDFEKVMNAIPSAMPVKIIFHNRYSTSGDWQDMRNNQPLHKAGCALAFNGTIDMGTKAEMERRYGIAMETDNDGEIVMNDIINNTPFAHLHNGQTFAGIFLDSQRMLAFRNELRPLKVVKGNGCKFICSTRDIALRAKFEENYIQDIAPNILTEL